MSVQLLHNASALIREPRHGAKPSIVTNDWIHCLVDIPEKGQTADELSMADLPKQKCSVPLAFWLENRAELLALDYEVAVQITGHDQLDDVLMHLADVKTIVLNMLSVVDGRSYSHAYLLRTRHDFAGEIRVIGDVHHDQVNFLARSGCSAFELPNGESLEAAQYAFNHFSEVYQPSADGASLIFSRRRAIH